MFTRVMRDADLVDAMRPALAVLDDYLSQVTEILATGWAPRGERPCLIEAAIGHATDFNTWRSLAARKCLTRGEAVRLIGALVHAAATP